MSSDTLFLFSLTVAFPAIVGIIRYRKMERSYTPFLIYIIISLLNELLVKFALKSYNARNLDWQLFNLFEAVILVTQFYYWRVFSRVKRGFIIVLVILIGVWFIENLVISSIYEFNPFFLIGKPFILVLTILIGLWIIENLIISSIYEFNPVFLIAKPFILVLLSVQTINHIIVNQNRSPLSRNAMFIICVALVIYFIYNIFVYTLQAKGISKTDKNLMTKVFEIMVYVNAFTNLLYGLAMCFIPERISRKNLFSDAVQND